MGKESVCVCMTILDQLLCACNGFVDVAARNQAKLDWGGGTHMLQWPSWPLSFFFPVALYREETWHGKEQSMCGALKLIVKCEICRYEI